MHRIVVISTGPGGKEYITDLAREKTRECEVIIGNGIQLDSIETVQDQTVYEESRIDEILDLLARHEGDKVGVLTIGDAGIYSLSRRIAGRFGKEAIAEVIPGISSIQVAFARVKAQWLNVQVYSFRDEPLEGLIDALHHDRVAILCDKVHHSRMLLSALKNHGLFKSNRKVYLCQDLTLEGEKVVEIKHPDDIERVDIKKREIILLLNEDDS